MNNLFKTKPLSELLKESPEGSHKLKRTLGSMNLVTLGIGAIIGAGIFVLSGQAAAQYAGPGIVISFIISAIACAFAGLCYAEFSSMIPIAGSAYTYAYATLGEFIAWIIGWDLILEYLFAASTVAVGWSGYVTSFLKDFGIIIPPEYTAATGTKLLNVPNDGWRTLSETLIQSLQQAGIDYNTLPQATAIFNFPAILIVFLITILLVVGIKESANFNNFMVVVKVVVILMFIVIGFFYIDYNNFESFIPENTGEWGKYGWSGVLRASAVIFFAYIGFDAVSTAAQEAKAPQKDMPTGILGSLSISTFLYILVALVLTGIVNYKDLNVSDPIAVAVNRMGPEMHWFRYVIKIAAISGLSSVILVMLMGQPRIFYTMAKDGLLPPIFSRIHSRFKTPYVSSILCGFAAMLISGVLPINILGELVSIGTLFAFVIVCIGVWVLRVKKPDQPRPFRTPWVPLVPILGALICLAQMAFLPSDTWVRLIIWMLIGIAIYFFYGRKHSVLKN
ncbi:MAG: amino acid permease [Cytophagales bacterium]|nr:MAG: amino acid permease [Cytophagales bacterium]